MIIVCAICIDIMEQTDSIFHTQCGHVYHGKCLLGWLEKSHSCPQCRDFVTKDIVYQTFFTFSNDMLEISNSMQAQIICLKNQITVNQMNIQECTAKNLLLKEQNASLKEKIYSVENEVARRNCAIRAFKDEMDRFEEQTGCFGDLHTFIQSLRTALDDLKPIHTLLSTSSEDITSSIIEPDQNRATLITYIYILKTELAATFHENRNLQETIKELKHEYAASKVEMEVLSDEREMELNKLLASAELDNIRLQTEITNLKKLCHDSSNESNTTNNMNTSKEFSNEDSMEIDVDSIENNDNIQNLPTCSKFSANGATTSAQNKAYTPEGEKNITDSEGLDETSADGPTLNE